MFLKTSRHREGRSLIAVLVLLLWAVSWPATSQEIGYGEQTPESVREFLQQLTLDDEALAKVDVAIAKLDSELFSERYLASVYLARLPVLPRDRLKKASEGAPLEKRLRIGQVIKVNTADRTDSMIVRAMEAVMKQEMSGLFPQIVGALEGRDLESAWDACVGACEVSAVESDLKAVKQSLSSETVVVRAGSAVALMKLQGAEAVNDIVPLAEDPDDRIKLLAAHFLRKMSNPGCLKAYASLLLADSDFAVRWESLDALQEITDQDFGYYASADKKAREEPAKLWMKWVDENSQTAKLNFSLDEPDSIVLFNGKDLDGWKEVRGFFRKVQGGNQGWGVEDGNLVCFGGNPGHLRVKQAFKDFHLKFEYRTPEGLGDSGLGLFLAGEDKVKPECLEVQILSKNTGDFYQIGGFEADDANGKPIAFRAERIAAPKEELDGWNRMEVRVIEGTAEVTVNGTVVNRASGCPDEATMFTLRNEGSRVEFRGLVLTPLD